MTDPAFAITEEPRWCAWCLDDHIDGEHLFPIGEEPAEQIADTDVLERRVIQITVPQYLIRSQLTHVVGRTRRRWQVLDRHENVIDGYWSFLEALERVTELQRQAVA